jgi:adenylate cyclase
MLCLKSTKEAGIRVYLLCKQGRCSEAIPAAQRLIDVNPGAMGPHQFIGMCLLATGRAADAILEFEQEIRINPRCPGIQWRYHYIGIALTGLSRYDEAIPWLQKSLSASPNDTDWNRGNAFALLAAAQALAGYTQDARSSASEATRLRPTLTVRSYFQSSVAFRYGIVNAAHAAQAALIRDGLRRAGIRDHVDEDADFGVASDGILHTKFEAATPTTVPGARTIWTAELAALVQQRKPLILDTCPGSKSIAGALGFWGAGVGGTTSDEVQDRLRGAMQRLTHDDLDKLVVTMAWNAERYPGRNLALRLVALGYTNVYWYRGGREAWEVAGLPETELVMQDW